MASAKKIDGREISSLKPRMSLMMAMRGTSNVTPARGPLSVLSNRRKAAALKRQGLPTYELTPEAERAQRRIDLANRYSNEENRAKIQEEFGEAAKEKVRIKYKLDPATGRYVRADVK